MRYKIKQFRRFLRLGKAQKIKRTLTALLALALAGSSLAVSFALSGGGEEVSEPAISAEATEPESADVGAPDGIGANTEIGADETTPGGATAAEVTPNAGSEESAGGDATAGVVTIDDTEINPDTGLPYSDNLAVVSFVNATGTVKMTFPDGSVGDVKNPSAGACYSSCTPYIASGEVTDAPSELADYKYRNTLYQQFMNTYLTPATDLKFTYGDDDTAIDAYYWVAYRRCNSAGAEIDGCDATATSGEEWYEYSRGASTDPLLLYDDGNSCLFIVVLYTEVTVSKTWNPAEPHADAVAVNLLRDGAVYDSATLSADDDWTYTWSDLDVDHVYTVEEATPDGYRARAQESKTASGFVFDLVNTRLVDVTASLAEKCLDGCVAMGESFTLELLADGAVVATGTLSSANNYTYTFEDLDYAEEFSYRLTKADDPGTVLLSGELDELTFDEATGKYAVALELEYSCEQATAPDTGTAGADTGDTAQNGYVLVFAGAFGLTGVLILESHKRCRR